MTTRREVLQGMIVSLGGASLLSACGGVAQVIPSSAGGMRFFSEEELQLLSRISDLIIPRTDTPGALDVNVPGFLDGLMAEWANAETQRNQHRSLRELGMQLGRDFAEVDDSTAENRLASLDAAAFDGRPSQYSGYRSWKGLITQAYFASEEGRLQEQQWVAVPGRWDPSIEI
ncbi:MAG: gluconate 2-dehydrogenase subunit 3 family protein [Gammaproteobacteria bacterium]|nr:gluconate 2-dehydrogenase subunit 3 family protein [Gammaproteobacteria bacterium]